MAEHCRTSASSSVSPGLRHCGAYPGCAPCWIAAHAFSSATGFSGSFRRVRDHAAGQDIVPQGERLDSLLTVLDGWLLLYELLEDGRRQILYIALPGDVLLPPVLPQPLTYGIQAVTPATTCGIPAAEVWRLTRQDPALSGQLLASLTRAFAIACEHLTSLGRRTARERVALLLVELYYRGRQVMPPSKATRVPLTQGIIGDALGLTSVHVNRTLRTLREEGLVAYRDNALLILDPDRLAAVAHFSPDTARAWIAGPPEG